MPGNSLWNTGIQSLIQKSAEQTGANEVFQYIPTLLHPQALWNKAQHYWVILLFSIYYSKQSWRDINTIILRRRIQKPFICAWKIWHLMTWNVLAWSRTYFRTHHHPPKHCRLVGCADAQELTGTCSTLWLLCYFQLLIKSLRKAVLV